MAQPSCGTRRRTLGGALLPCLLMAAACGPSPPPGAPAAGGVADSALTSRGLPADSPNEPSFEIGLDALTEGASAPGPRTRNPFRFARAAPPPSLMPLAGGAEGRDPGALPATVDGWRPAGDAEEVRFVGVLEAPESAGRVAVLTDGAGVHHGRVGDVVGGRYRIVALDRSAVRLERLEDGRRLTLRPSGE